MSVGRTLMCPQTSLRRSDVVRFDGFSYGSVWIDEVSYDYDVVMERVQGLCEAQGLNAKTCGAGPAPAPLSQGEIEKCGV